MREDITAKIDNSVTFLSAFSDLAANLIAVVVHMGSRLEQVSIFCC